MDPQEFITKLCNPYWQRNMFNHATPSTTILGQVDSNKQKIMPEKDKIRRITEELNIKHDVVNYILLDTDNLVGLNFASRSKNKIFQDEMRKRSHEGYIVLDRPDANTHQIRINAYPSSATRDQLQAQLTNYGQIKTYGLIQDNKFGCSWFSNNLLFTLQLRDGVSPEAIPCFVRLRRVKLMLMVRGQPPVCYACRLRGHKAKDCTIKYCTTCQIKQPFIHHCADRQTPSTSYASKASNINSCILNEVNQNNFAGNSEINDMDRSNRDELAGVIISDSDLDQVLEEEPSTSCFQYTNGNIPDNNAKIIDLKNKLQQQNQQIQNYKKIQNNKNNSKKKTKKAHQIHKTSPSQEASSGPSQTHKTLETSSKSIADSSELRQPTEEQLLSTDDVPLQESPVLNISTTQLSITIEDHDAIKDHLPIANQISTNVQEIDTATPECDKLASIKETSQLPTQNTSLTVESLSKNIHTGSDTSEQSEEDNRMEDTSQSLKRKQHDSNSVSSQSSNNSPIKHTARENNKTMKTSLLKKSKEFFLRSKKHKNEH